MLFHESQNLGQLMYIINGENEKITSREIKHSNGIFQGDGLSVILFMVTTKSL